MLWMRSMPSLASTRLSLSISSVLLAGSVMAMLMAIRL